MGKFTLPSVWGGGGVRIFSGTALTFSDRTVLLSKGTTVCAPLTVHYVRAALITGVTNVNLVEVM